MMSRLFKQQEDVYDVDHLVITSKNPDKTVDFYVSVLGAKKEIFKSTRIALVFDHKKFNVHPYYGEPIYPRAENPMPGSLDICFRTKKSIEDLMVYFQSLNIPIIEGPVDRTGALGPMRSIYIRDPDGNLLEFANYPVKAGFASHLTHSFMGVLNEYKVSLGIAKCALVGLGVTALTHNKLLAVTVSAGLLAGYSLWSRSHGAQNEPSKCEEGNKRLRK